MMRRVACRPRIAIVSPWLPQTSGVADYAAKLADELGHDFDIDAFHDPAIPPVFAANSAVTPIPAPLLPRLIGLRGYRALFYQMGNSSHHHFLYPLMLSHPGIVTLHDLRLTNFHHSFGPNPRLSRDHLLREIAYDQPVKAAGLLRELPSMQEERGGIPVALAKRGIDLNRRVFETSQAVIVHSSWAQNRAIATFPNRADSIHRVPFGAMPERVSAGEKRTIRARLDFPKDAVIIASLGFLGWGKMNEEAIEAFGQIAASEPRAVLAFAGKDLDDNRAAKKARDLGLSDRVRFLRGTTDLDLCDLAKASDIGVNLRREPTNGETSGTLFTFLRQGIPTIVTDVDSFGDEPESVVVRLRWRDAGMPGLVSALRALIADPSYRERVGRAAFDHVRNRHSWPEVSSRYRDLIERVRPARNSSVANSASA